MAQKLVSKVPSRGSHLPREGNICSTTPIYFMAGIVAGGDEFIELSPLMFIEEGIVAGAALIESPLLCCLQATTTSNNASPRAGNKTLRIDHKLLSGLGNTSRGRISQ
jgi:hypothetical protein